MNSWDKNRNQNIYKQKLQSVKSTMTKSKYKELKTLVFASPNGQILVKKKSSIINSHNKEAPLQKSYQRQQSLKKILSTYGLQQYLRKFYELGYDDNNINKLSKISHKDMEDFMMRLKIFPGHKVKLVSFIENMKKIYLKNGNDLEQQPKKRFHSVNTNRMKALTMTGGFPKTKVKPKSVETLRTNNRIVKSFAKGNGFGLNYYLENDDTSGDTHYRSNRVNLMSENKSDNKSKEGASSINEEIDKLLNFYIVQLNEKIDDSIDSLDQEDSSLSNFNSIQNILNNKNIKTGEKMPQPDMKVNLSEIKPGNNETISSRDKVIDDKSFIKKESQEIHSHLQQNLEKAYNNNLEEQFYNDYADFEIDEILNQSDNEKNHKEKNIKQEIQSKPIINNIPQQPDIVTKIENPSEDKDNCYKDNINKSFKNPEIDSRENPLNSNNEKHLLNQNQATATGSNSNSVKKYSNENESEDFQPRLVKSCEEEYLRQHIEYFDIEYMCRCLGIALMKHLESGQDKSHIMDLIDLKENFSFFNSLFNINIELFNTFFSEENLERISNLDKLEQCQFQNSTQVDKGITKTPNTVCNTINDKEPEKNITGSLNITSSSINLPEKHIKPISFLSHMQSKSESSESESLKLSDLEKEMKTINDYFNYCNNSSSSKVSKYDNMNENTKAIFKNGLDSIKELDSMDYCSKNRLNTVKTDKSAVLLEVLRQSAVDFIGADGQDLSSRVNCGEEKEEEEEEGDDLIEKNEKFNQVQINQEKSENLDDFYDPAEHQATPFNKSIPEDIPTNEVIFESGVMESNYLIDISNAEKLKSFLLKAAIIYDDDYDYKSARVQCKRYSPPTDPIQIFEFCANIIILTKMEKEVIMICLIYIERFIFNTGLLLNSRNWKRLLFTSLVIASKIWDDDSFENNHFAQVFPHLAIGEINLMERTFLELINYKVYVKCSEYFKYFFIIKSISLKYNFNGVNLTPMPVQDMIKLQESAYIAQKKLRKKYSINNSAQF